MEVLSWPTGVVVIQMLVPSSVFVSRDESRRDTAVERVRSFSAEQLSADTRGQRWDRVRIVCSQPYNKHCKVTAFKLDGSPSSQKQEDNSYSLHTG